VACNACTKVCPVEILPQLAFKSLLADDIEEALAHGLLDCVECGLCTYVCPAKIELCHHLTAAKRRYYQEQNAG
jgi:Na+-transporting NADH:ubiquinone oxidoreductase subunit A